MSFDDLPEEQVDHILRYALCDRARQGDGETPRSWLQVPAVRLVCLHWAATHRQARPLLSPVGEAFSIVKSLLDVARRSAMLRQLNDTFISKHEQSRLANLREAEERVGECTRVIQLIETKISDGTVLRGEKTRLQALLTQMKQNETALKHMASKLSNASITF